MSEELKGLNVVSFESRMAGEMAKLVKNFGGNVMSAPSMQEIPFEKNREALDFGEKLFAGRIDMVIFLTGVGTRALFQVLETRYPREKIVEALKSVVVVVRGPKPQKALRDLSVPIAITVHEPNTWREVLQELDENEASIHLDGKTIAVQEYGEENEDLIEGLRKRKATAVRVPVYRWALPDDTGPLKEAIRAIVDGRADVALFTNKVQADHVLRVAVEEGVEDKLKKAFRGVVVASVGPICTEGLLSHGISVDLESVHSKIGSFVMETARQAAEILRKKKSIVDSPQSIERIFVDHGPWTMDKEALHSSLFMRACRREKTERTPIWLMRQAGRYMKEYRDIRRKRSFLDLCRDKDLVTEVTVQAQEYLNADAAIIFSDILLLVEGFGLPLEYAADEGPVIGDSIGEGKRIEDLRPVNVRESLGFVLDAIRQTRRALKADIPLLGFAAAPFTLASYMIEGGASKNFRRTKVLMYREPSKWEALMARLVPALSEYLAAQIDAGAQAVQVFDSWAGCLGPEDYRRYAAPHTARVIAGIGGKAPVIHFGTGNPELLGEMARAGGDVIGADFRVRLDDAWKKIGPDKGIQGNLDPLVLCADRGLIKERAADILAQAAGRPGHIFNLGHGVLPETPPENAKYLIDIVHEMSVVHGR